MNTDKIKEILTPQKLETLFPAQRSDDFFEAFYGDAQDSHFDIKLQLGKIEENRITLEFHLIQRPGKCLACNMTYGLPHVLARHPVINIEGLVNNIAAIASLDPSSLKWTLENTSEKSSDLHVVPLIITTN